MTRTLVTLWNPVCILPTERICEEPRPPILSNCRKWPSSLGSSAPTRLNMLEPSSRVSATSASLCRPNSASSIFRAAKHDLPLERDWHRTVVYDTESKLDTLQHVARVDQYRFVLSRFDRY